MNISTPFGPPGAYLDASWLEHRFRLFETFTLPSIDAQTSKNFDWLVYSHPDTPEAFARRLESYCQSRPMHIVLSEDFDEHIARSSVLERARSDTSHLITSRVDNDDALGKTFLETVQSKFCGQDAAFLNFDLGLELRKQHLYRTQDLASHYCSAIEAREKFGSVFATSHAQIATVYPVEHVRDKYRWLTIVHERNAINTVSGQRCSAKFLMDEFDFLDLALVDDRSFGIAKERVGAASRRVGRRVVAYLHRSG